LRLRINEWRNQFIDNSKIESREIVGSETFIATFPILCFFIFV
jgi:hypothetical protein